MRFSTRVFAAAAFVILLANGTFAEILTYQVTGTINADASKIDLPVYVPLPTTMTGSLVYNTANSDTDPAGGHGLYYLESLTLTMGAYTIAHNSAGATEAMFDVLETPLAYRAFTNDGSAYVADLGQTFTGIEVELFDLVSSYNGIGDAFPLSFPNLSTFDVQREFSVKYSNAGLGVDIDVVGTVDTILVPEPATISLLMLASLFLRRRQR